MRDASVHNNFLSFAVELSLPHAKQLIAKQLIANTSDAIIKVT